MNDPGTDPGAEPAKNPATDPATGPSADPATAATKTAGGLKHRLWFGYIVFLILWSGCVYNWLGKEAGKHELFARVIDGHPYISDFVNVYNSASLAAACEKQKIDIYSPTIQAEFAKKLTAPVVPEQPFFLQYPPFLFAVVRPLAYFDLFGAWLVWCTLGLSLVTVSAIALTRNSALCDRQKTIPKFTLVFVIAATLASFPTWLSVELGQTSLPLVPGLVAFWICCQRKRYFLAGLASGVVMIKLQYLPPVFVIGFLLGAWQYLAGFCTIGIALLALSVFILGPDNVMHFPQALLKGESSQGVSGVAADQMQNLRGNLTLLVGSDNLFVHMVSMVAFALALAFLAFIWWRYTRSPAGKAPAASNFRVLAAFSTLIMLTVSPHCHTQDYLALVIPCIWLWFELDKIKPLGPESKPRAALRCLVLLFPILGWPFFVLRMFFQMAKIQPFFVWAVCVCVLSWLLYVHLWKNAQAQAVSMPTET